MGAFVKKIIAILVGLVVLINVVLLPRLTFANGEIVPTLQELQNHIFKDMTNRETSFAINYVGDRSEMLANLANTVSKATSSDDYLALSFTRLGYKETGVYGNTNIIFTAQYITTKAEEDYITSKIKEIIPSIVTPDMSDDAKEEAIHDYIINHVSYDYTLQQNSAYTALTSGKTTCLGYSMLLKKMLNEVEIKSQIITGYTPDGYHAWNIVQINDIWFHVDITNDTVGTNKYRYFNATDDLMTQNNYIWDKTKYQNMDI